MHLRYRPAVLAWIGGHCVRGDDLAESAEALHADCEAWTHAKVPRNFFGRILRETDGLSPRRQIAYDKGKHRQSTIWTGIGLKTRAEGAPTYRAQAVNARLPKPEPKPAELQPVAPAPVAPAVVYDDPNEI